MNADGRGAVFEELVGQIKKSAKYSAVDEGAIKRTVLCALYKYKKKSDALKAAKNELHLICECFSGEALPLRAQKILAGYCGDILADRELSLSLMALHSSTRERLGEVEAIYAYISSFIGEGASVADLGCGLGPMALPFFSRFPAKYDAFDIDKNCIEALNAYFTLAGKPDYRASALDAASDAPADYYGAVFLFKLLPLLRQQKKGREFELLGTLKFGTALVSFPTRSLSGREKGMKAFYSAFFEGGLPPDLYIADRAAFENELFYAVKRKAL